MKCIDKRNCFVNAIYISDHHHSCAAGNEMEQFAECIADFFQVLIFSVTNRTDRCTKL